MCATETVAPYTAPYTRRTEILYPTMYTVSNKASYVALCTRRTKFRVKKYTLRTCNVYEAFFSGWACKSFSEYSAAPYLQGGGLQILKLVTVGRRVLKWPVHAAHALEVHVVVHAVVGL